MVAELLHLDRVGVNDDIFDQGGNSLVAMQLVTRCSTALGVRLPLTDVFSQRTVARLARLIDTRKRGSQKETAMVRQGRQGLLPLSPMQEGLWVIHELDPQETAYNVVTTLRLKGPLDVGALRDCVAKLTDRHEAWRTSFSVQDGELVQEIAPSGTVDIEEVDLQNLARPEQQTRSQSLVQQFASRPFDLRQRPLARVLLIRRSAQDHTLVMACHHIVVDGWSITILSRELATLYAARLAGKKPLLSPVEFGQADYAVWARERLKEREAELTTYWRKALAGLMPLELPSATVEAAGSAHQGALATRSLSPDFCRKIYAIARAENASVSMVMLAAFGALLARYTGQEDICVGMVVGFRSHAGLEETVGCFIDTLPVRFAVRETDCLRAVLQRVRQASLSAYEHRDLPFLRLVETVHPARSGRRVPVVQVLFNSMNQPEDKPSLPGIEVTVEANTLIPAQFDLELDTLERDGSLHLGLVYNRGRFSAASAASMLATLERLLAALAHSPDEEVGAVAFEQAHRPSRAELDPRVPLDKTFVELFAEQARRSPSRTAATCGAKRLTYRQLAARTGLLARNLSRRGVGTEAIVPLLHTRDLDFLAAVLGIMKAGAAYLPLDPGHPPRRLAQILEQSRAEQVVVADNLAPLLAQVCALLPRSPAVIAFSELSAPSRDKRPQSLPALGPRNLAYVIFTSGSTGRPKGAMLEQRGMVNHLYAKITDFGLGKDDVVVESASQCFDISVWQFLSPLLVGGRTEIVADEVARDPKLLCAAIEAGATVVETVPSMLALLLDAAAGRPLSLKWMVVTGEAVPPDLCRRWFDSYPDIPLVNAYGPTECSDDVTHNIMRRAPGAHERRVSIGRPILNTEIYVLDRHQQRVPNGVAGEICVGGVGVGRGYLHDAERTAAAFVPDPFQADASARMYRTGDLGRARSDGTLDYLGRLDRQIKLRGMRLDLEEITAVVREHPEVKDAIVVAVEKGEDHRLIAYVAPPASTPITASSLRAFLKERLPAVMIPAAYVSLAALPLTTNGKIDYAALPAPPASAQEQDAVFIAPRGPLELLLAQIWGEYLHVERIGIGDNFFDLGGHSLAAVRVQSRLQQLLGVELPLTEFFASPTIEKLARRLEELAAQASPQAVAQLGHRVEAALATPANSPPVVAQSSVQPVYQRVQDIDGLRRVHRFIGSLTAADLATLSPLNQGGRPIEFDELTRLWSHGELIFAAATVAPSDELAGIFFGCKQPYVTYVNARGLGRREKYIETLAAAAPVYRDRFDIRDFRAWLDAQTDLAADLEGWTVGGSVVIHPEIARQHARLLASLLATGPTEQEEIVAALFRRAWPEQQRKVLETFWSQPKKKARLLAALGQQTYRGVPGRDLLALADASPAELLSVLTRVVRPEAVPFLPGLMREIQRGDSLFVGFELYWLEPLFFGSSNQ